jgi:hypothetical protein
MVPWRMTKTSSMSLCWCGSKPVSGDLGATVSSISEYALLVASPDQDSSAVDAIIERCATG